MSNGKTRDPDITAIYRQLQRKPKNKSFEVSMAHEFVTTIIKNAMERPEAEMPLPDPTPADSVVGVADDDWREEERKAYLDDVKFGDEKKQPVTKEIN